MYTFLTTCAHVALLFDSPATRCTPLSHNPQPSLLLSCRAVLQTFLPLLVLGIIFSSIFLLTRNLLSPIILHSLWNIFVLYNLLCRPV